MVRHGSGAVGWPGRLFRALVIPVVILGMVRSLFVFEWRAASARERSALILETELRVHTLHAILLEQLARGPLPNDTIVDAEISRQGAAATASIDSFDLVPAASHFAEYVQIASHVWRLVETEHTEEGHQHRGRATHPDVRCRSA